MAINTNVSNVRNSKPSTPEEQNAIRRAKKKQQKPGNKPSNMQRSTTPSQLKTFDAKTFTVRTSATALLDTPYKEQMVAAFGKFFTKNTESAFNLIWELTYQHEETKPHLLNILGLSSEMVPDLSLLLVELVAQYRAYVNRDFMQVPCLIDEVKPAFDAIYNENHATALFVYDLCTTYIIMNPIDHIYENLDRLGSTAENRIHGGILDMIKAVDIPSKDSRYALSAYLKPRHEKIYHLLKAMVDVKASEEKKNVFGTASALANLADACKAAGYNLAGQKPIGSQSIDKQFNTNDLPFFMGTPDEEEKDQVYVCPAPLEKNEELQPKQAVKELTLDNILSNREDFVGFINQNSAMHLMNLLLNGFQIDQINAKKAVIAELLEHHAKMVKAAEALTK